MHSVIHQLFSECLLCAGHCARYWGDKDQTKILHDKLTSLVLLTFIDKKQVNIRISSEMGVIGTVKKRNNDRIRYRRGF